MTYDVIWKSRARRAMNQLPEAVAAAIIEYVQGDLREAPHRCCGAPLTEEPLVGLYRVKRGGYRVVLDIDDEQKLLTIHDAGHRNTIYRR